jgi:hypothetical protein
MADFFYKGDWDNVSLYPCTNQSIIVFQSPTKCLFDDLTTSIEVRILQDINVLSSHALDNINGNISSTNNNITINVSEWTQDTLKYSANITISINISNILTTGGRFKISMDHICPSGTYNKTQNDIFYDANLIHPLINTISINTGDGTFP